MTEAGEIVDANQSPVRGDLDLFGLDAPLQDAVSRNGAGAFGDEIAAFGRLVGAEATRRLARDANRFSPELESFDRKGDRADRVSYHPAWNRLMQTSAGAGLHAAKWEEGAAGTGRVVARAAAFTMMAGVETGHLCPITMTHAAGAALAHQPDLASVWLPRIARRAWDPRQIPAGAKDGVTFGMGMTERQGGTDVRANTTAARPLGNGMYAVTGHKWFMSAPMSDAFLVLAQAPGGLTCFLVPRLTEDGDVNGLRVDRLKDKLGNRSNASSEVRFEEALGQRVGEEGRGVPVIIEMATMTRLDCALASAGLMRAALAEALHHARHRMAFGRRLAGQPLMAATLADLAVETEAAVALVMRLAAAFDTEDEESRLFRRVMTPAVKYWVCKRAPAVVGEAMEALGGNGYVETFDMARHYREAPVNSIWEGSGNVMCLDLLRAFAREKDGFVAVLDAAFGEGGRTARDGVAALLSDPATAEAGARIAAERIALHACQHLLETGAPAEVADVHRAGRIAAMGGTFAAGAPIAAKAAARILERALPG
jgi:putative acyl-CoA dehydrogenase